MIFQLLPSNSNSKVEKIVITPHPVFRFYILLGFLSAFCLITGTGESFPITDAFDKKQNEATGPNPRNETTPQVHRSLQPMLNDQYNEPHPFPESIVKSDKDGKLPEYYRQLLLVAPEDHVQSKIFDMQAFKEMKKIGVLGFENKTYAPYTNAIAGEIITDQAFAELRSTSYTVISPPEMNDMIFRMKIVTTPKTKNQKEPKEKKELSAPATPEPSKLPFTAKDMDGVLVGAVTKYMDSYKDEQGEWKKSISSGVEFGAYLISTKTGNVVWGARYASSQPVNLLNTLKGETKGISWLDKEELSRNGMKKVLKIFYETRGQKQELTPLAGNQ